MRQVKWISLLLVLLFGNNTLAESGDFVTRVYSCNNDVGLLMQNAGWVVVREASVGEKRVDRIFSLGLSLVATQNPTGFFNPGAAISWCGIASVRPITVLGMGRAL